MTHAEALVLRGRCGACAERIPRARLLRGLDCPACHRRPVWSVDFDLSAALQRRLGWKRWAAYGLVGLASFGAGLLPALHILVHPVLMLAALFIAKVMVVRQSLRWLSPTRRLMLRLNLKLLAAALSVGNLALNVAVAPLASAASLPLSAASVVLFAVYLESARWMLGRRLRWEAAATPLQAREWLVPVGLLAGLLAVTGIGGFGIWGLLYVLTEADIPAVSDLAEWLLGE